MKALVKTGPGKEGMILKNLPEPVPGSKDLKIRVKAAGICGTDMHIMLDEYTYNAPVVMGHEYVGVVEEVGAEVSNFKIGDWVVSLTAVVTCGECRYCREGLLMLCSRRKSIGSGVDGAFAEYIIIPANLAFIVPDEIEDKEELAICEPFACIVRGAVERAHIKAGDIVLISGPGTIGLMTVQLAKLQGAYVIVCGIPQDEHRLKLACELGANQTVSNPEELKKVIQALSPDGVDVACECAGVAASAEICLESVRKQGIYSQIGLFGKEIAIDFDRFLFKELTITNSFASERTSWETALRLLKYKMVTLKPLISAKVPLEKWQDGFDMFMAKKGYKILLIP